ncbi:hypothetical protein cyc_04283 [Cyclospora cayetanensis]|uniref:Uncharacterized protein n=1 Tax=Cyclospora cayetanensis TaxID=88456 RepID=A0A1D3D3C9_9EIME|nr:hypothetical protein cyc_04283 [Cyclospora cayetanensis]
MPRKALSPYFCRSKTNCFYCISACALMRLKLAPDAPQHDRFDQLKAPRDQNVTATLVDGKDLEQSARYSEDTEGTVITGANCASGTFDKAGGASTPKHILRHGFVLALCPLQSLTNPDGQRQLQQMKMKGPCEEAERGCSTSKRTLTERTYGNKRSTMRIRNKSHRDNTDTDVRHTNSSCVCPCLRWRTQPAVSAADMAAAAEDAVREVCSIAKKDSCLHKHEAKNGSGIRAFAAELSRFRGGFRASCWRLPLYLLMLRSCCVTRPMLLILAFLRCRQRLQQLTRSRRLSLSSWKEHPYKQQRQQYDRTADCKEENVFKSGSGTDSFHFSWLRHRITGVLQLASQYRLTYGRRLPEALLLLVLLRPTCEDDAEERHVSDGPLESSNSIRSCSSIPKSTDSSSSNGERVTQAPAGSSSRMLRSNRKSKSILSKKGLQCLRGSLRLLLLGLLSRHLPTLAYAQGMHDIVAALLLTAVDALQQLTAATENGDVAALCEKLQHKPELIDQYRDQIGDAVYGEVHAVLQRVHLGRLSLERLLVQAHDALLHEVTPDQLLAYAAADGVQLLPFSPLQMPGALMPNAAAPDSHASPCCCCARLSYKPAFFDFVGPSMPPVVASYTTLAVGAANDAAAAASEPMVKQALHDTAASWAAAIGGAVTAPIRGSLPFAAEAITAACNDRSPCCCYSAECSLVGAAITLQSDSCPALYKHVPVQPAGSKGWRQPLPSVFVPLEQMVAVQKREFAAYLPVRLLQNFGETVLLQRICRAALAFASRATACLALCTGAVACLALLLQWLAERALRDSGSN